MGQNTNYTQYQSGGVGKKRPNPGMSGDYTPEEFPVPQVPNQVQGLSDVQPAQPKNSQVGMGNQNKPSMTGVDSNPQGNDVAQVQTSKFKDNGVQGPKSPRPAKL